MAAAADPAAAVGRDGDLYIVYRPKWRNAIKTLLLLQKLHASQLMELPRRAVVAAANRTRVLRGSIPVTSIST